MDKNMLVGTVVILGCVLFVLFAALTATLRIDKMARNGYGSARWSLKQLKKKH